MGIAEAERDSKRVAWNRAPGVAVATVAVARIENTFILNEWKRYEIFIRNGQVTGPRLLWEGREGESVRR